MAGRRLWVNELFVTLVLHPGRDGADRAAALMRRLRRARRDDGEMMTAQVRRLEDAGRDLAQYLDRYTPRQLGLLERNGLWFSEPLEIMALILTGRRSPTPLVYGHLGAAAYTVRAIFGRETLELRDTAGERFGGILAIKEYPATTRPGLWDALLNARFGFVMAQSFAFLSKSAARAVMERKQNQMVSARDRAGSQIEGLSDALDDLVSNRFVMGEHQASVLVHGDTPADLADHLSKARAILADSGLVVARQRGRPSPSTRPERVGHLRSGRAVREKVRRAPRPRSVTAPGSRTATRPEPGFPDSAGRPEGTRRSPVPWTGLPTSRPFEQ